MSEWGHKSYQQTEDNSQLRLRITTLFINYCLKDDDILEVLRHEGYQIGEERLVRLCKELGLFRRIPSKEDSQATDTQLRAIVQDDLEKMLDSLAGYGR